MNAARLVLELVAAGAWVGVDGDRLLCRLPPGVTLSPELEQRVRQGKAEIVAALHCGDLAVTVRDLQRWPAETRAGWAQALAHDLAAFSQLLIEGGR